jgi:threonine aldolase
MRAEPGAGGAATPAPLVVDLRSDTVTQPTPAMRAVLAQAEVGDDGFGDDPSVGALEHRVAVLLGTESALFFPSGIMANQAAILALGEPGTEILTEADAHLIHYEEGSVAAHGGMLIRGIPARDGILRPEELTRALRPPSRYQPTPRILALENTHLASGGRAMDPERTRALSAMARDAGLRVHLDGARLWNAAAALGVDPAELVAPVDTVMTCLSKGLGAPAGSMLAGPRDLVDRAWRIRRRLGGQMRQVGILAAAALYALDHHRERLVDDHRRARTLMEGLTRIPGVRGTPPETNVVLVDITETGQPVEQILAGLRSRGIGMGPYGPGRIRAVLHLGIGDAQVDQAVGAFEAVFDR